MLFSILSVPWLTFCERQSLQLLFVTVVVVLQKFCCCFWSLCIRGTSHGPVSVSVCHQVGVLLKRLNVGSHKQHHMIAQGL